MIRVEVYVPVKTDSQGKQTYRILSEDFVDETEARAFTARMRSFKTICFKFEFQQVDFT